MFAADRPNETPQAAEVRKAISNLEKKFNDADAKGLAACWSPQGEFIGPDGQRIEGRDNIEKAFAEFFAHNNAKLEMPVTALRLLGDAAAIVHVISLRTSPPTAVRVSHLLLWSWSSTKGCGWSRAPRNPRRNSSLLQPP